MKKHIHILFVILFLFIFTLFTPFVSSYDIIIIEESNKSFNYYDNDNTPDTVIRYIDGKAFVFGLITKIYYTKGEPYTIKSNDNLIVFGKTRIYGPRDNPFPFDWYFPFAFINIYQVRCMKNFEGKIFNRLIFGTFTRGHIYAHIYHI
jgi:hypothetical protein